MQPNNNMADNQPIKLEVFGTQVVNYDLQLKIKSAISGAFIQC